MPANAVTVTANWTPTQPAGVVIDGYNATFGNVTVPGASPGTLVEVGLRRAGEGGVGLLSPVFITIAADGTVAGALAGLGSPDPGTSYEFVVRIGTSPDFTYLVVIPVNR
jgi:hypothetical protein